MIATILLLYIFGGMLAGATAGATINPYGKDEWGQWTVCTFLWPLAALVFIVSHLGSGWRALTPDRAVTMSRKQRREILFMQEKNRLAKEALETQREYESLITKSGYEVAR